VFPRSALALLGALFALTDISSAQWGGSDPDAKRSATAGLDRPQGAVSPLASPEALANLQRAIDRYRQIDAAGGWQPIPKGPPLRAGDNDERVDLLRQRLAAEGEISRGGGFGFGFASAFDATLEEALKRLQERHGLRPSGILNGETLTMLNIPASVRVVQLTRSAERMAELLPHMQSGRHVLVNIPSFELQVVSGGEVLLYSRVIVGKPATATPSVHATARAVDLMPYWHVPPGVAQRAIIPAIRKDPTYLARERIRVFSAWGGAEVDPSQVNWNAPQSSRYVFRQDPGPHNALGLVRIDMPNQYTVYMHDTPLKRLFESRSRAYSAGCVRVRGVYALAGLLLGEDEESVRRRLEPLLAAGEKTTLRIANPVPVHFAYLTAWADPDGRVEFRHDLYDKDGVQAEIAAVGPVAAAPVDPWHTRVFDVSP
jgi:L,D-transpeptidase YcbB